MRLRLALSAALTLSLLGACAAPVTPGRRVIMFQDGSVADVRSVVTPAVLGLSLALEGSGVSIVVVDIGPGTGAGLAEATEAAADPQVMAAVVSPFTAMPAAARDVLLNAGVQVISMSWLDEPGPAGTPWRRIVDPLQAQAETLVQAPGSAGGQVCVSGEGSLPSEMLGLAVEAAAGRASGKVLRIAGAPEEAARGAASAGCDRVIWTGSAPGATRLLRELQPHGIGLVLGDQARTDGFLEAAWPAGGGTFAVCSCVDLSASADPQAQEFIHAYQEFTGLDAGPWAAEGYDVGRMVLEGETPDTLGGPYRWDAEGDPATSLLRIYRAAGARWLEQSAIDFQEPAPAG